MVQRPFAVTLIGGLEFILGVLIFVTFFFAGISAFNLSTITGIIAAIVLGGIPMVIGYGILKGWSAMWWIGIILNGITAVLGILSFPSGIFTTIVAVIIVIYLLTDDVKRFFGI